MSAIIDCPPPEMLARFLDEELNTVEHERVTRHLDAENCPFCLAVLEQQEHKPPLEVRWRPSPAVSSLQIPGYDLLEEVGRGGFSTVYRARRQADSRVVAVKVLSQPLDGEEDGAYAQLQHRRYFTEVLAMLECEHPGVVRMLHTGRVGDKPYLVMEFMAGGSLRQVLRGQPQPILAAASWIRHLAESMAHVHNRGFFHRDLKPANILLCDSLPRFSTRAVCLADLACTQGRITDFGLARLALPAQTLSKDNRAGTLAYMAPERFDGGRSIDWRRVDIYALGVILYEMLIGRLPFAADGMDVVGCILNTEPTPPRQVRSQVPRDLETICLKCLRKDPAERYSTMAELAEDLRRFQQGRTIRARRVHLLERVWKWGRRQPVWAAVLLLVSAGAVLWWHTVRTHARQIEELREQMRQQVREQAQTAR